jgi:hypothetical protein
MRKRSHLAKHHDISDSGPAHKYFVQIPNTIVRGKKGKGLSLPARWLYVFLKSVAGDEGECTRSTTTLAREAQLGRGTIAGAKQELINAGLITVTTKREGYHDTDRIRMVDLWLENMQEFASLCCSPNEQQSVSCSGPEQRCSPDEQPLTPDKSTEYETGCSGGEQGCSPPELKKIPIRRSSERKKDLNLFCANPPQLTKAVLIRQAQDVLAYFNHVHGRNLKRADQMKTLLGTGVSVEDCHLVIEWLYHVERVTNQDGYHKYVDNVTPFRPMNFDRNLDKARTWADAGRPGPRNGQDTYRSTRDMTQAELAAYLSAPKEEEPL